VRLRWRVSSSGLLALAALGWQIRIGSWSYVVTLIREEIAGRPTLGLVAMEPLLSSGLGYTLKAKSTRADEVGLQTLTLPLLHRQIISFKFNRAKVAILNNIDVRNV